MLLILHGPTLVVDVGFDPSFVPTSGKPPALAGKNVGALVDTGAVQSFIDSDLAKGLQLPVIDTQTVSGSHGRHEIDVYLAQIYVQSLDFTVYGRIGGVHLSAGGQRHYALLGRTFLRRFHMNYNDPDGAVKLTIESK